MKEFVLIGKMIFFLCFFRWAVAADDCEQLKKDISQATQSQYDIKLGNSSLGDMEDQISNLMGQHAIVEAAIQIKQQYIQNISAFRLNKEEGPLGVLKQIKQAWADSEKLKNLMSFLNSPSTHLNWESIMKRSKNQNEFFTNLQKACGKRSDPLCLRLKQKDDPFGDQLEVMTVGYYQALNLVSPNDRTSFQQTMLTHMKKGIPPAAQQEVYDLQAKELTLLLEDMIGKMKACSMEGGDQNRCYHQAKKQADLDKKLDTFVQTNDLMKKSIHSSRTSTQSPHFPHFKEQLDQAIYQSLQGAGELTDPVDNKSVFTNIIIELQRATRHQRHYNEMVLSRSDLKVYGPKDTPACQEGQASPDYCVEITHFKKSRHKERDDLETLESALNSGDLSVLTQLKDNPQFQDFLKGLCPRLDFNNSQKSFSACAVSLNQDELIKQRDQIKASYQELKNKKDNIINKSETFQKIDNLKSILIDKYNLTCRPTKNKAPLTTKIYSDPCPKTALSLTDPVTMKFIEQNGQIIGHYLNQNVSPKGLKSQYDIQKGLEKACQDPKSKACKEAQKIKLHRKMTDEYYIDPYSRELVGKRPSVWPYALGYGTYALNRDWAMFQYAMPGKGAFSGLASPYGAAAISNRLYYDATQKLEFDAWQTRRWDFYQNHMESFPAGLFWANRMAPFSNPAFMARSWNNWPASSAWPAFDSTGYAGFEF